MDTIEIFLEEFLTTLSNTTFYDGNNIIKFRVKWLQFEGKNEKIGKIYDYLKNNLGEEVVKSYTIKKILNKIFPIPHLIDIKKLPWNVDIPIEEFYKLLNNDIQFFNVTYDKSIFLAYNLTNINSQIISDIIMTRYYSLNGKDKITFFLFIEQNFSNLIPKIHSCVNFKENILSKLYNELNFDNLDINQHFYPLIKNRTSLSIADIKILEGLIKQYLITNITNDFFNISKLSALIQLKKILNINKFFKAEFFCLCPNKNIQYIILCTLDKQIKILFFTASYKNFIPSISANLDDDEKIRLRIFMQ